MNAVLLEFPDEAEFFARECHASRAHALCVVALSPAARVVLLKQSIPCESTLEYFGADGQRDVQLARESMIHEIQKRLVIPASCPVPQSCLESIVSYARFFLGHLMKTLEIAHRIQERHDVKRWMICRSTPEHDLCQPIVTLRHRYVADLVTSYAQSRDVESVAYALPTPPSPAPPKKHSLELSLLERGLAHFYFLLFRFLSSRPLALVSHLGYEMDTVVRDIGNEHPDMTWFWLDLDHKDGTFLEIKKAFIRAWRLVVERQRGPFSIPMKIMAKAVAPISGQNLFLTGVVQQMEDLLGSRPDVFRYRGVSLGSFLSDKMRLDLIPHQLGTINASRVLDRVLLAMKPRVVLSQSSEDVRAALGELCRARDIPAVLISHGSNVPTEDPVARIEHDHLSRRLMHSTYPMVALQSPAAAQFAERSRIPARLLSTGPLIWSRLSPPDRRSALLWLKTRVPNFREGVTRVVLFVCAASQRHTTHFYIPETQDENMHSLCDVIHAVHDLPDVALVVRYRPQHLCSIQDMLALLPADARVAVHAEGRFAEALAMADLVVAFYSATVEEALNNRIPVLLYGGGGRYRHLPATLIDSTAPQPRSAVYWVRNPLVLKTAIPRILQNHLEPLEPGLLRPYTYERSDITPISNLIRDSLRHRPA